MGNPPSYHYFPYFPISSTKKLAENMLVNADKGLDEGNKVKRAKCISKEVKNAYAKRIMEGTLYWCKII